MQLQQYLRMLLRGWWIIALTTLTALLIALLIAYTTPATYRASSRFIISPNNELVEGRDVINSLATLDKRSIAATYAEVLNSRRMLEETAQTLGIDNTLITQYAVTSVVLPEANILELSVAGRDPVLAVRLVNEIGRRGIEYINQLYPAFSLQILDAAVVPSVPESPNPLRDASLAGVLGLILGTGLTFGREYLRLPLQQFQERAHVDSMSGAFNRRYFERYLEERGTLSTDESFSLGLIRLPELDDLQDVMPEAIRQRLLRRITTILQKELRSNDLVGRWTDSSFALALPATDPAAASRTLERIRKALSSPFDIGIPGEKVQFTPRVAIVAQNKNESPSTFIERIELALKDTQQRPLDASQTYKDARKTFV